MKKDDFACIHPMRVRWAEVDMQGVVFNAHYLMYFDTASAEYWRAISVGREKEIAEFFMRLYVVKATVEYHGSAHYDEMIDVGCRVARFGRTSMTFQFAIWRGTEHLISGEIVYVHAAPDEKKSAPIPDMLREAVLGYERSAPEAAATGVPR